MRFTPGKPRYVGSGVPAAGVPAGGSAVLAVQAVAGGAATSPSQSGLLLLYRDGKLKNEVQRINVESDSKRIAFRASSARTGLFAVVVPATKRTAKRVHCMFSE